MTRRIWAWLLAALAAAPPLAAVPADRVARRALDADLLGHDSATLVLDRWCGRLRLADPATVVADRVAGADKPIPAGLRRALRAGAKTAIGYRRVRLRCGATILSDADNWYVPARLPAATNRALETSDVAFGRAVRPLGVHRRTLADRRLRLPRPLRADSPVLEHRALLELADGTPISVVVETYRGVLLGGR